MLKNLRNDSIRFEHLHWHNNKRSRDDVDDIIENSTIKDFDIYQKRSKLSLKDRLKI